MKVLEINAVYGFGSTGGIVKEIRDCCEQNGIEVFVAFPKGGGVPDDHCYEIGTILDHKLHALFCRLAGKQAYFSRNATKSLLHYIDTIQPNLVHLHNLHSNYINVNMLLKYLAEHKIRTIITMHDCWWFTGGCFHYASVGCSRWQIGCGQCPKRMQDTPAILYDGSKSIIKDRIKYLSAIPNLTFVGVSKWVVEEYKKSKLVGAGEVASIYNGFDFGVFKPVHSDIKKRLGLEGKKVILGPAAKWFLPINKSTFDYFVEHLPGDFILLLFGTDDVNQIMPSNVKLSGYTRNQTELAELYSMADVLVNCSREDTLSSINIEAQACGTPVITYDETGMKETVDGVNSMAIECGNYERLFNKTIDLVKEDCNGRLSGVINFTHQFFDRNSNYIKYVDLYINDK